MEPEEKHFVPTTWIHAQRPDEGTGRGGILNDTLTDHNEKRHALARAKNRASQTTQPSLLRIGEREPQAKQMSSSKQLSSNPNFTRTRQGKPAPARFDCLRWQIRKKRDDKGKSENADSAMQDTGTETPINTEEESKGTLSEIVPDRDTSSSCSCKL